MSQLCGIHSRQEAKPDLCKDLKICKNFQLICSSLAHQTAVRGLLGRHPELWELRTISNLPRRCHAWSSMWANSCRRQSWQQSWMSFWQRLRQRRTAFNSLGAYRPPASTLSMRQHLLTHLGVFKLRTICGIHLLMLSGVCQKIWTFSSVNTPEMELARCSFHDTATFTCTCFLPTCLRLGAVEGPRCFVAVEISMPRPSAKASAEEASERKAMQGGWHTMRCCPASTRAFAGTAWYW